MSTFNLSPGTVNYQLWHWSQIHPNSVAFIFHSDDPNNRRLTLTRRDVFLLASRYAAILRRKGLGHGNIVCNTLPNSPERLLTDLGILMTGAAVLNGLMFLADRSDFLRPLQKAGCVAVVSDLQQTRDVLALIQGQVAAKDGKISVECPQVPSLKYVLSVDCKTSEDGLKPFLEELKKEEDQYVSDAQPSDLAYIMASSGSTGFSKMVPRTHAMLLGIGRSLSAMFAHQDGDVFFNDRALGWMGGAPLIYLVTGGVRVLTDLSTTPADSLSLAWNSIWDEGATIINVNPYNIDLSLARPELWQGQKKVRCLWTGGQPVRKQHLQVLDSITESVCIVYGSTEAGFNTSLTVTADNRHSFQDGNNGLPIDGLEIKLVDDSMQEIKEADKIGEILLRGRDVFTNYIGLDQDEEQDVFTPDGFFRTKDIGFRNDQGHLHIVCRKSNVIMHGVFIVYPGWLESRMEKCPGVRNVIVVPVPDPVIYEEMCACVVAEKGCQVTEEHVREFCQSQFLVPEKAEISVVPKLYLFFDSFPTTSTGKTDRKAIREEALKRLALNDAPIRPSTDSASRP